MAKKKCDCCGKNNLKTGELKSSLSNKKFIYCLICGAMNAEPRDLIEKLKKKIQTMKVIVESNVPLIYYDKESDKYIDIRKGTIPFYFKDRTILHTRSDVLKRLKEKGNIDDIFVLGD